MKNETEHDLPGEPEGPVQPADNDSKKQSGSRTGSEALNDSNAKIKMRPVTSIVRFVACYVRDVCGSRERLLLWTLSGCVFSFLLWSMFFTIDVASNMKGEVVPSGQVKRVQHLEGGIVSAILVREGDSVQKGQPVIELSSTQTDADVGEVASQLQSLTLDEIRLEALLGGNETPNFLAAADGDQERATSSLQVFTTQRNSYLEKDEEQIQIIEFEKNELRAQQIKLSKLRPRLSYVQEQIRISEKLLEDGLTNRFEHLDLLKDSNSLESQIETGVANAASLRLKIEKERAVRRALEQEFREKWSKELSFTRKQMDELGERIHKFEDSQARTVIRAPVAGTVFKLFVHNTGAVIPPGGMVMTIVPGEESLIVDAKMMVADVGFVKGGQQARIQLLVASGSFQPIQGTVVNISADAVSQPEMPPYYEVRIRPEKMVFTNGKETYPLLPGVEVQVAVFIGERTLFNYVMGPVFQSFSSVMMER